ncbi:sensor histidine kinase [Streptomyces sp. NBC_01210]|uniref:sensor histidine kinase n=1 Tax=Streptomyces sp. NBC_01210 TaxID=2903774 RepID=UPI002E0E9B9D|nr:sensor histidine kinase [Streptomyces sp. NBC_01210]
MALGVCAVMIAFPALVRSDAPDWTNASTAVASCLALPWCRRWPIPALAWALGFSLASVLLTALVFPAAYPVLFALYIIGRTQSVRVTVLCTAVCLVAVFATVQWARHVPSFDLRNGTQLGWFVAAAAIGVAVDAHANYREAAEERVKRAEESREIEASRRVAAERLRIAQELHDVIGHSMAMINVQAGVAGHVIDKHPGQVRESLERIRVASSTALEEIRTTLGLLRQADPERLPVAPVLGLNDVPALVHRARAGGVNVDYTLRGNVREVPAVTGSTVYRLVQEALTNAVKYAGQGAQVEVEVHFHERHLRVAVTDDGGGVRMASTESSSQLGLRGMRERVEAVGGTLEAGRRSPGFQVKATIPTEAS